MFATLAVMETDLQHVSSERLEARITELSARIAASVCEWLLLVGEFDRRKLHEQWECHSPAHWLNWQCGISMGPAREHVRVARALAELTAHHRSVRLRAHLVLEGSGITRVATPTNEAV